MNTRCDELLGYIIEEYVKTAQPIGSKLIAEKSKLDVSPATVRNDMAELERDGFIFHPHTSAGRVPTDKGYQYYIDTFEKDTALGISEKKHLQKIASVTSDRPIKELAKCVAELSGQAVIIGFGTKDTYYTGLANLFSQPEFQDVDYVYNMSEIIDHLDDVITEIFEEISAVEIFIGKKNPFGKQCSTIISKFESKNFGRGVVGLLGPTRMNYKKNVALLEHSKELIFKM
jgi:heat-inducible transcriptional repressor